MQQLIRRLVIVLSIAATVGIFPHKAFATHLAGSDISYTWISGNSYLVTLTFYRDCGGSPAPNGVGIEFRSVSCNRYFTDTLLRNNPTGSEISYNCPSILTKCDNPASPYGGFQQWRFSKVITFPMQCSDWVISWTYCCRNCAITTMVQPSPCVPGSNPPMYIDATLDNLNYSGNSSPRFDSIPLIVICKNDTINYSHGTVEPDGDSLVYTLVNPLINSTTPITFKPGFNANHPISDTLMFSTSSGQIVSIPHTTEVGVLSVRVDEYRNGVLIGHVIRDLEIIVQDCNNTLPTATGINGTNVRDTTVCPGTQLCFDVFSNDVDPNQFVIMQWNAAITGATFTVSGFPFPTGHFCWTPGINDTSNTPHYFTVSVHDNNCPYYGSQTYTFSILVKTSNVNVIKNDISCHGLINGSISVVPLVPGNYYYQWSPGGQTSSSITNLGPGIYSVTVIDSSLGCPAVVFQDTITDPPILTDSAFAISASCSGSSSGSAAVIASGGTPSYSYLWNTIPPTANDTASNLATGNYLVTVTDSRGCTSQDSVAINTSSSAIIITVDSVSSLLCYADTNGIASVSVSGGTPSYTYTWNTNPVQTGPTATGLSPGTYYVTVTDSLGCSKTDSATVTSPPQIVINTDTTSSGCGVSTGVAYAIVSGGSPGYTYSWVGFPANTADSLPNIPPGLYHVIVTDTNNCSEEKDILVQSAVISSTANAISQIVCHGDSNAVAIATASGGTPPYTYQWNTVPPQNNDTATGLPAGNYIVTITDSANCYTVDTVNIPDKVQMSLTMSIVNASCVGDSTGSATVHVSGGAGPFIFSWTPYGGTDSTATNLIPGTYVVSVTDASGCIRTLTDSVQQNSNLTITVDSIIQPHCYGDNNGFVYITVTGGTGPYTYIWNFGLFTTEDLQNIGSGNYSLVVTDRNNCSKQQLVGVGQPPPLPIDAGANSNICTGSAIQLDAHGLVAGLTGTWSTSAPSVIFSDIHDTDAVASIVPPGLSQITWTVSDNNGCSVSINLPLVNLNLRPDAGPDDDICGLGPVQLNAMPTAGLFGYWTTIPNINFNDTTLSNATVGIATYGSDTLTWTQENNVCRVSDLLIITSYEMPTAEAGDTQTVCEPKAKLVAVTSNLGTGSWSIQPPGLALIYTPTNETTDVSSLQGGRTFFVWTVVNGACSVSDTVYVDYRLDCDLDLPTGFSPNNDGYNDGYYIKGLEGYPDNIFRVFNRWGNIVYEKTDYKNSEWIGQNTNGEDLPEGTYFVILQIRDKNIKRNTYVDLRRSFEK